MVEKAALTRLRREYAIIQQSPKIPHIVARPSETNILVWNFVLHDLPVETPYRGGVYEGKLVFPREYPLKPPAIYMLTPSGRFDINTRLCLSMSDFHPESWNPSWRIESILVGLVSFMLDPSEPRTTGGMHTSEAKRREYARASFGFNTARPEFRDLFPEFCDEQKRGGDGLFSLCPDASTLCPAASGEATGPTNPAGKTTQADKARPLAES
ncbi:ubc6 [Symbiodinium natans]|uniref:Ubc6 protein n=1 Tax=Symbiodinium natans TaxID=878477 RepID=A0A812TPB1_9DINO|nr:ubc6 [Symbiodinium natans]